MDKRIQTVADIFDRASATYDQVDVPWFTPIAAELVRLLAPREGEQALDIGCGRGAALFPLAEAVGPTGRVTGIDLAPGMLQALGDELEAKGMRQVDLHLMDAAAPPLDSDTYDVLASSLVLFFLPDPVAALSAWRELLKTGGRIGVSTFGRQDPRWVEIDGVFTPYLPPQMLDARTSGTAGPFSTDLGVESILREAGFHDVRTATLGISSRFADPAQWREWSWSHGQRAMWEAVPEANRQEVYEQTAQLLEKARTQTGDIALTQEVRYTLGRRTG